jgi:biotin carboxyl carrier protein
MKFTLLLDGAEFEMELGMGREMIVKLDGVIYKAEAKRISRGIEITLGKKKHVIEKADDNHLYIDGHKHKVEVQNLRRGRPSWFDATGGGDPGAKVGSKVVTGEGMVYPPMPGRVVDIKVKKGDKVTAGSPLLVLEAMKMQNEIVSHVDGTVQEVRCSKGSFVESGDVLVVIS